MVYNKYTHFSIISPADKQSIAGNQSTNGCFEIALEKPYNLPAN
jgi:hypothetical protein